MKSLAALVTVIALGVGALVGTAAYQVAAAPQPESVGVPVAREMADARVVPGARFTWAPCRGQATLRRGVCVTQVVATITSPATPANESGVTSDEDSRADDHDDDGYREQDDDELDSVDDESEAHESDDDAEDHESEDEHEDEHEDSEHDD